MRPLTSGRNITLWRDRETAHGLGVVGDARDFDFRHLHRRRARRARGPGRRRTGSAGAVALPPVTAPAASPVAGLLLFWYHQAAPEASAMPTTATTV